MIKWINKIAFLIEGALREFCIHPILQAMNCDTVRWSPNLYWIPLSWLHTETLLHVQPFALEPRAVHVNVCPLPPHLHSCSVPLTRTLRWAEALPFPLWCQNKYHFFIWSCAASWEVALTPAWASPSSPPLPPLRRLPIPRWGQEY